MLLKKKQPGMQSKNVRTIRMYFFRKLNIQVCELLQLLTGAIIEICLEKQAFLQF